MQHQTSTSTHFHTHTHHLCSHQYGGKEITMASVLALSMLWILPSSIPPVLAWMPPSVVGFVPSATTKAKMWRHQHQLQPWATTCTSPSHLSMSTVTKNEESLEQMTVPELKERLRSVGQKVCRVI